jgi:hypothetical protein
MDAKQLEENFTNQFNTVIDEIKNLEAQLSAKRELALKLKGAIEALNILEKSDEEQVEETPEE